MSKYNNRILLLPHTITRWFSCDYVDVYRPILENASGELFMIDKYINNRTSDVIDSMTTQYDNVHVNAIDLKETVNCNSITELRTLILEAIDFSKFDDLVLTHGHTFDSYATELKRYQTYLDWVKQDTVKLTSYQWDFAFIYILAELCARHDVTIHSIWFDPLQIKLNYIPGLIIKNYSFHAISEPWSDNIEQTYTHPTTRKLPKHADNTVKCLPSKSYIAGYRDKLDRFIKSNPFDLNSSKELLLSFGMSLTWKAEFREKFVHTVTKFNNDIDNKQYYLCYKASQPFKHSIPSMSQNPTLPYSEYVDKVANSMFTIMLPSMDINSFSVIRFIESICSGTIPLIFDNNKYESGLDFNQEIIDIYKRYDLFLDSSATITEMYDEIKLKTELLSSKYIDIIRDLQSCQYLINLSKSEFYQQEVMLMLPNLISKANLYEMA